MANTQRNGRVRANQAAIDEVAQKEAAQKAQEAARRSNEAKLEAACAEVLRPLHDAEARVKDLQGQVTAAQTEAATKHEAALYALAAWSHENGITAEMVRPVLHGAMVSLGYSSDALAKPVSTEAKLMSQLARAMSPKVSGSINTVLRPWLAAWDAEAKRKEDELAAAKSEKRDPVAALLAQPLRDKFTSRNNLINQALQLAVGRPAVYSKTGKETTPAIASVVFDEIGEHAMPKDGVAPGSVLSWLAANPKVSRGAKTPTAATTATTASVVVEVAPDASPRDKARAEVTALINAVNAVGSKYPAATELFNAAIEALRVITGDKMLPSTQAPSASDPAPTTAPTAAAPIPAAEVLSGPAETDNDAMIRELEEELAMRARLRALKSRQ